MEDKEVMSSRKRVVSFPYLWKDVYILISLRKDEATKTELLMFVYAGTDGWGYGGNVTMKGLEHALVYNFTLDNRYSPHVNYFFGIPSQYLFGGAFSWLRDASELGTQASANLFLRVKFSFLLPLPHRELIWSVIVLVPDNVSSSSRDPF